MPALHTESHQISLEEKEILALLEENLQTFKASKPTATGYARWVKLSRAYRDRINILSQRRLHQQYGNLRSAENILGTFTSPSSDEGEHQGKDTSL